MPEELRTDQRLKLPIYITTAHFYLADMTEDLGPTKIVPGSHLSGRSPKHLISSNGEKVLETNWNGVKEQKFSRSSRGLYFISE